MVLLDVLIYWFHNKVAVDSVVINNNNYLNTDSDPSLQIISDDKLSDNHLLKRQKRVLVFRPLFVYKQQQKEKQMMREKWKAEQQLYQQQYQSNYQQQYYQQYLQNYYNQFTSSSGYYQQYNQPNYVEQEDLYSNTGNEQSNYWSYSTGNDLSNSYYTPHQHTASCYSSSTDNPSHYNSLSSDYYYV